MTYTHILVPVDFSDTSVRALEHAKAVAARFEASLELLHVVPNPYYPKIRSTVMRRGDSSAGARRAAPDNGRDRSSPVARAGAAR